MLPPSSSSMHLRLPISTAAAARIATAVATVGAATATIMSMASPCAPRTKTAPPLTLPPARQFIGDVSFKATCDVTESDKPIAKVVGYSPSVSIGRETENACRLHKPRTGKCSVAELVMIRRTNDNGIYWISNGGVIRKLV